MKLLGQGRLNKFLCIKFASVHKSLFIRFIHSITFKKMQDDIMKSGRSSKLELVTFSNSANFYDFVLSVLSFLRIAGLPKKWTLYCDDQFKKDQIIILEGFSFLELKPWNHNLNESFNDQYTTKWQFRKYVSFSTHPIIANTIFLDSDVLFHEKFILYTDLIGNCNWYLPEPPDAFSVDNELKNWNKYTSNMYIVNSGFMILSKVPDWNLGMEYLKNCVSRNHITHFSEQSAVNIVFTNDSNAKVLDARVFHVSTIDHFDLTRVKTGDLAIRHYVGPVRHKMWQSGWRKYISLYGN